MLYVDDAGIVSQSPGNLENMMDMLVNVWNISGLTVSQANTEIRCLYGKDTPTAECTIHDAGQVLKPTNKI